MTAYLLDTNLLIGALDPEPGNTLHEEARQRLRELLMAPDTRLAITPLIRYEVLRGVRRQLPEAVEQALDRFIEFEVTRDDAVLAAKVYAQALTDGGKLDKRSFDVFHCVAAHRNQLDVASRDGDIPKIMAVLQRVSPADTAAA
jgi:predicted nucleic acid-binding protein